MSHLHLPPALLLLAIATSASAQGGAIIRTFQSPTNNLAIGLEHDGAGNLLHTALAVVDEVLTMDTSGTLIGTPWNPVQSGNPIGITTDGSNLYITDTDTATGGPDVDVYNLAGGYVRSFSVAAQTSFPEGITFSATNTHLYVTDGINPNCHEYDRAGALIASYPLLGSSVDGIAHDPATDTFWVGDSGTDTIRHYDNSFVQSASFPGTGAAGHPGIEGVALVGSLLYVCASSDGEIVVFDPVGTAAQASQYGAGCPNTGLTFYEMFAPGMNDLNNTGFLCRANAGGGWDISACANCWDPNYSNALNLSDDSLSGAMALGFSFRLPGSTAGNTTAIDICSNGYVWAIAGSSSRADYTPSNSEFVAEPERFAPFWTDLNPAAGGQVYFDAFPTHAMATWVGVPEYGQTNAVSLQVQFFPNGDLIYAYQTVANASHSLLVGYSTGNGATDPGSMDLSAALPFSTSGGGPLALSTSTRPVLGTTMTLTTGAIPPNAIGSGLLFGSSNPALPLGAIGMPGCTLLSSGSIVTMPIGTGGVTTLPIPNDQSLLGSTFFLQSAAVAPGVNQLGVATSNGLSLWPGTI